MIQVICSLLPCDLCHLYFPYCLSTSSKIFSSSLSVGTWLQYLHLSVVLFRGRSVDLEQTVFLTTDCDWKCSASSLRHDDWGHPADTGEEKSEWFMNSDECWMKFRKNLLSKKITMFYKFPILCKSQVAKASEEKNKE